MGADVKIGDRTVTIGQLNGFKAVRAGRLVAEAASCLPEVQQKLADLREQTFLVVTPELAALPRFQRNVFNEEGQITGTKPIWDDEDFRAAGGKIRIQQNPETREVILAVFPVVFAAAEKQVVELLALVAAPNSELADADENGTVDDYLERHGRKLLHEATLTQLIALVTVAVEEVAGSLAADPDALGKVAAAVTGSPVQAADQPPIPSTGTVPSTPESPTGSPGPTDGIEGTVSTEHRGEKSSLSLGG